MQVPFDYNNLNKSYATRELTLSDDYLHRYIEEELASKPILSLVHVDIRSFYQKRISTCHFQLDVCADYEHQVR